MEEEKKILYQSINQSVLQLIPRNLTSVLDVGCGTGEFGFYLKSIMPNCIVHGITYSERESVVANTKLDKVFVLDLDNFQDDTLDQTYDCIICSHVLEHLTDPLKVLLALRKVLANGRTLVIALPNILFFKQRFEFLIGNFKYSASGGLMDITHYRFFDWNSAHMLVKEAGYQIVSSRADGHFPLGFFRKIKPLASWADSLAEKKLPGLFGHQFIIVATK